MDPFSLLLAALFISAVFHVAVLTIEAVRGWFAEHSHLLRGDSQRVAVTVKEALHSGRYRVVQGVFDRRSRAFVEQRVVEADELDAELRRLHDGRREVVHTL